MASQALRALATAVATDEPIAGLTHAFYAYPARFSPLFARAAIRAFTEPGDLVLDPFVGGGTTLVEAAAEGRRSLGCDINELAVFVSRAKTDVYSDRDLRAVMRWAEALGHSTNLRIPIEGSREHVRQGYFENASSRHTWHVRKFLELATSTASSLDTQRQANLARCLLLRLGRWALDCRVRIPRAAELRIKALELAVDMTQGARSFSSAVRARGAGSTRDTGTSRSICLHASAMGLERNEAARELGHPKLVVCSPPYPGMHVLYHRWQVSGRKETPIPYWIAGCTDGKGPSFYTMGGRRESGQQRYFREIGEAFSSLARLMSRDTTVVQLVSFSCARVQLPMFLDAMRSAGFTELLLPRELATSKDGRLWRAVPNRRWYAHRPQVGESRREIALLHTLS